MGWGYGINLEGREVGYTVSATCDDAGCLAKIDRGLAYACGDMHDGGDWGCGLYFCGNHLLFGGPVQLCAACLARHSKLPECDSDRCVAHELDIELGGTVD